MDNNPNLEYKLVESLGCPKMMFQASKDIEFGEQLFIDYRADYANLSIGDMVANKAVLK